MLFPTRAALAASSMIFMLFIDWFTCRQDEQAILSVRHAHTQVQATEACDLRYAVEICFHSPAE
jgi:hypothetical protein